MRIFYFSFLILFANNVLALPTGFVYLSHVDPTITQDIRYAGSHNFVGRPIKGYLNNICILTINTANALAKVQQELQQKGLSLKVFDCYRPTMAVMDFVEWSYNKDQKMKAEFYPKVDKKSLFAKGYVAKYSQHSFGNTVDLTIDDLNMGSHFDFLDHKSHLNNTTISEEAIKNRKFLSRLMIKYGFVPYAKEWWHYTYPEGNIYKTRFNFSVK